MGGCIGVKNPYMYFEKCTLLLQTPKPMHAIIFKRAASFLQAVDNDRESHWIGVEWVAPHMS